MTTTAEDQPHAAAPASPSPPRDPHDPHDPVRNALDALARIEQPWQPHRLATVNDHDVKIARFRGAFVWHSHPDSDELFHVLSGRVVLGLRDEAGEREVVLGPHDVFVVPRGVPHRPSTADDSEGSEDAVVLLVELEGTVNTGDVPGERTQPLRELG